MPILDSAKKRARQNVKANKRNHARLSRMRSLVKNIVKWTKNNEEIKKAEENFSETQKSIDMCEKNNLIPKGKANREKRKIAKALFSAKNS
jgi:ribosomal protein S20